MSSRGSLGGVKARGLENDATRCIEHVGLGMKFNRDWGENSLICRFFAKNFHLHEKLANPLKTCKSTKKYAGCYVGIVVTKQKLQIH